MKLRTYINHPKLMFLGGLTKLIEVVLELFLPIFMGLLIDQGVKEENQSMIYLMLFLILVFTLMGYLSTLFSHYLVSVVSQDYAHNLRVAIVDHVNQFSLNELNLINPAKLSNTLNSDVLYTSNALAMSIRIATRAPFLMIGSIIALFIVAGNIAFLLVLSIPILGLVLGILVYWLVKYFSYYQTQTDQLILLTKENIEGAKTIKAYVKEEEQLTRFKAANLKVTITQKTLGILASLGNPLTTLILYTTLMVILWFLGIQIDTGDLTQGSVFAVINYTTQLVIATMALLNLILLYTKAFSANERIVAFLSVKPSVGDDLHLPSFSDRIDSITLEKVSFKYPHQSSFLTDLDFKIKRGEKVGIVGLTSAGKSTLALLLSGFLTPTSGRVLINGNDLKNYNQKAIKNHIAYASNESLVIRGSIRDNLAMGQDISDKVLLEALNRAEFRLNTPDLLNYQIKKDGHNLSGGQKARLNIARSLSHHRDLLVLDDVFASLDYQTDQLIRKTIFNLDYQPMIVIISQRISSVVDCDQIFVLDHGQISDQGTHYQLMQKNNLYQKLYLSQQTKEEEVNV